MALDPSSPDESSRAVRPPLAGRVRLPRLSGKTSAAVLLVCFVLTAALIPRAVHRDPWIDFEIVLGVWWAIWFGALAWLLYTGQRVTDDFALHQPRSWLPRQQKTTAAPSSSGGWWNGFFWGSALGDGEGLAVGCMIVIGLILLGFAIWVLIEFAIPLVAFVMYFVVRGMLARVINDHHHCRGRVLRALSWGGLWATVYTAPLAGVVWVIHAVHAFHQGNVAH